MLVRKQKTYALLDADDDDDEDDKSAVAVVSQSRKSDSHKKRFRKKASSEDDEDDEVEPLNLSDEKILFLFLLVIVGLTWCNAAGDCTPGRCETG